MPPTPSATRYSPANSTAALPPWTASHALLATSHLAGFSDADQAWIVVKKASAKKPPRSASIKAVPMKVVTELADCEGEKCMCCERYNTKLLAFAKNAKFSNTSTTVN
nr:hypothetical protein Itr_chr07CG16330 [Ipomoea trifida]